MKPLMTLFRFSFLTIFSCLALAFGTKEAGQNPPLFVGDEMLNLRLAFNMDSILADRGADPHYHNARISVREGSEVTDIVLKIKPRGNFRLSPLNCAFPPIRLNFKEGEPNQSIFSGQDKLKMVTHCSDQKYVLKEYLAYKIYQLINPASFQVRLAKVTYVDFLQVHQPLTRYAFILEDEDFLAIRLGGELVKGDSLRFAETESMEETTARLYLFQYMIGNRDWDIELKKNIKIVRTKDEEIIPIPYDFDFTGWVNAPYTTAYMGDLADNFEFRAGRKFCLSEEEWQSHMQFFQQKKAEIFEEVSTFEFLKKREKGRLLAYVESFYTEIENPQEVKKLFGKKCP